MRGANASAAAQAKIDARNEMEEDDSDEDKTGLEVYGEKANYSSMQEKGKEKEVVATAPSETKKRRRGMDPWQGVYCDVSGAIAEYLQVLMIAERLDLVRIPPPNPWLKRHALAQILMPKFPWMWTHQWKFQRK